VLVVVPLLRASRIKPWAECASDAERLDVYNGLLLALHLDALFDGGWISFAECGKPLMCSQLSLQQQFGVWWAWRLAEVTETHRDYLAWHRREIFRK
jgi:putative restriction endonuclease